MNRVWDNEQLKGGRLLVMLALADHANDAGECWPSQPHLAKRARLNERQVRRVIDGLANDGYMVVVEKGVGRSKRPHYRLFPQPIKSDILSDAKADILSQGKSDISDTKADISAQENRTFLTEKSDISDVIPSRERSEPPIEPTTEPPMESSSSNARASEVEGAAQEDEEDEASILWLEICGDPIPANIKEKMRGLIGECGSAAVAHGIRSSLTAHSRNFRYIAECARNFVPESALPPRRYSVEDVQGIPLTPRTHIPSSTPPPPANNGDPWSLCLSEMTRTLPSGYVAFLEGSRAEFVMDNTFCRIILARPDAPLDVLRTQLTLAISRKLSSILHKHVDIEIVAAEQAQEELTL